jgi:predicted ABC-type transport system involved in lysophospholipase L1 biosynthesis ATPase subunit
VSLLRDLGRRKVRTSLTILGITIGIWALVVVVTHDEEVGAACDRVVRMRDGRIRDRAGGAS